LRLIRLALVVRRFWPFVGGVERTLANMAVEMVESGAEVTILTAKLDSSWPAEIDYRGVAVVRLPYWNRFGNILYHNVLGRWLRANRDRFDVVCVSSLKQEARTAVKAIGRLRPVVLRAEDSGRFGDCIWQLHATGGRSIKRQCLKAATFVGPSRIAERELQAAGYPRDRITYIPNGPMPTDQRSEERRAVAREALANIDPSFRMQSSAPLVVYNGRLAESSGLAHLLAAWGAIVARWPNARLYLCGDGPYRRELARQISALKIGHSVSMIGSFGQVEDLLAAANLFVLPTIQEGLSIELLEAMEAGLPIVATQLQSNLEWLTAGQNSLCVPTKDANALRDAIQVVLEQPEVAKALGRVAKEGVENDFPLARMVDEHLSLFESLIDA